MQADEILPKINAFKQYYVAGTCLLLCMSYDVAVMWHIPLPNKSPYFEVSAILALHEIDDMFAYGKDRHYEVLKISILLSRKLVLFCLW